jgi:hypothetical protein
MRQSGERCSHAITKVRLFGTSLFQAVLDVFALSV